MNFPVIGLKNIDSYHDKCTAFSFTLSVSGVCSDEFISNDGNYWHANWKPGMVCQNPD
ncbi:MAG: hypothetical protein M3Z92_14780 [Bacteroidota bacterium]|nr:hypothetical protein [Bacteroidota bacterium]